MRWIYTLPLRLRSLFWKNRIEQELSDELRFHLEKLIEEKVGKGMTREEARYAALRELGGVEQIKEECRDMRRVNYIETFFQDVRYGLRMLAKNPGFTAVAVLTLTVGIGANTAIFSLMNAVMLRDLPVEQPDELLQVQHRDPRWSGEEGSLTNALWEQVRDRQDVFAGVFAWGEGEFDLAQGGAVRPANGIWVSGDFFRTLGLRPVAGRLISTADDQPGCPAVAVLSYGFWQDHYGRSNTALGSILTLNSRPFEVIGVTQPGFYGMQVGEKFDVAVPICTAAMFDGEESRLHDRSWWWLRIIGRFKPGVSPAQRSARLAVLSPAIFTAAVPQDWAPEMQKNFVKKTLVTAPAAGGVSALRRKFDQPLQVLMGVVGLVLLIACANIASLMLARGAARAKEIAVRQALGASRSRLVRQFLTECVLLSSTGALLGIFFGRWCSALLVRFISTARTAIFLDLSLDGRVLGFTAAVAVLTSILFGLLPALRSTRVSLTSAMKGRQAPEIGRFLRFRGRRGIVASQVALSLVLLVAAGLLLRSFAKLATLDIGFDRNNVLLVQTDFKTAKVPPELQLVTSDQIESRLRALPGVVSVGRSFITPIHGAGWNQVIRTEWSNALTGDDALVWLNSVSPGFFGTLRMPILAGRNFDDRDTKTAPAVAIVNQTLARRFFPNVNPIGRTFRIDHISGQPGPPIEVVGLIKDSKYQSVREDNLPTAFFPVAQAPPDKRETFELRTAVKPSALVSAVQSAVAGVNNRIPLEFRTLAEQVDDSLVQERLLALLSGFFGVLGMLLAMIGLYGTLNYLVTQRQAEFGVRMALGARSSSILRLVMRDVIVVLAVGVAAGVCLSLATTRLLQKMLFGLGARDLVTMIGAVGMLSVVALFAGYLPARRATKVDPMVALRCE